MLELEAVNLGDIADALDDNSYEHSWWFDPRSGEVRLHVPDVDDEDVDDLDEAGLVPIEAVSSHVAYSDMEDFVANVANVANVADRRVAQRLERALGGRGPFRRFKDVLHDHIDLLAQWYAVKDARMRVRAVEWLADRKLIPEEAAERAIAEHEQLHEGDSRAGSLSARVASDLHEL